MWWWDNIIDQSSVPPPIQGADIGTLKVLLILNFSITCIHIFSQCVLSYGWIMFCCILYHTQNEVNHGNRFLDQKNKGTEEEEEDKYTDRHAGGPFKRLLYLLYNSWLNFLCWQFYNKLCSTQGSNEQHKKQNCYNFLRWTIIFHI